MVKRIACALCVFVCLLLIAGPTKADPPPSDAGDWLTWMPMNVHNNAINLTGYQNKTIYVVLFSPDKDTACSMVRAVAAHVRAHPNHAGKVLAMCMDDTGYKAIRLYLRQEEYTKRVAAWSAEQDAAAAAAQQSGATYNRPPMPDFVTTIESELETVQGRDDLMAYHLPFTTCARCEDMWTWLLRRITKPEGMPRALKFNPQATLLNEWDCIPNPNPLAQND